MNNKLNIMYKKVPLERLVYVILVSQAKRLLVASQELDFGFLNPSDPVLLHLCYPHLSGLS